MILFFAALIFVMWRTLKVMPRIKPQQIKPASQPVGLVRRHRRRRRGEGRAARRSSSSCATRSRSSSSARRCPRASCCTARPGTGKTLLAKAVAHESGAQFFAQSAASFVEMFAGLGAARIRRLFAVARKHEPAIIFIDELDAVGGRRGSDISGEKDQTLNQLLVEMDGFAAQRPRRRDRRLEPAREARPGAAAPGPLRPPGVRRAAGRARARGVLEVHTRDKPLDDVDLGLVAQQTSGLTGADLANICNEAAIFATRRKGATIAIGDFDSAIERVIAGVQSRRVLNEHEKRVVAYHEAGHALCGELLPSVDRVHRISIVPRGRALGYTLNLPAEDRYLKTREELLDYMTVLLGGRVAEQIVFGAITTGASDDLKRVADDRPLDGPRLRDGHGRHGARARRRRAAVGDDAADPRRGAPGPDRGGAPRGAAADRRPPRASSTRSRTSCSSTRCSSATRSSGSWPACRGWSARPASACASSPPRADAPARHAARDARAIDCRGVFNRIDHIGVAVEELEPALALYRDGFELDARPPRGRRGAGRRGGAARRRREPRRAARAARRRHAGRQVPRQARPRPAPRRLPGRRHRRDARRAQARPGLR